MCASMIVGFDPPSVVSEPSRVNVILSPAALVVPMLGEALGVAEALGDTEGDTDGEGDPDGDGDAETDGSGELDVTDDGEGRGIEIDCELGLPDIPTTTHAPIATTAASPSVRIAPKSMRWRRSSQSMSRTVR